MILAAGAWENRETRETIVATENFMFFDFLASDICRLKGFSVWRKPSNLARLYTIPFSWKYHGRFSLSRWFECWLISLYTSFCDAVHAHLSGPQGNENDPGWDLKECTFCDLLRIYEWKIVIPTIGNQPILHHPKCGSEQVAFQNQHWAAHFVTFHMIPYTL